MPARRPRPQDGRIALLWTCCRGEPFRDGISYARQELYGAISAVDGQTWSPPRVIARIGEGEPLDAQRTRPLGCIAPDGRNVLIYYLIHKKPDREWWNPIVEMVRIDPDWLAR